MSTQQTQHVRKSSQNDASESPIKHLDDLPMNDTTLSKQDKNSNNQNQQKSWPNASTEEEKIESAMDLEDDEIQQEDDSNEEIEENGEFANENEQPNDRSNDDNAQQMGYSDANPNNPADPSKM